MPIAQKLRMVTTSNPILETDHPDLIQMFTMDNVSGSTLVDESPNNNDGTFVGTLGSAPVSEAGVIDNAYRWLAQNASSVQRGVDIGPASKALTQGAISMWLYAGPLQANFRDTTIYANWTAATDAIKIMRSSSGARLSITIVSSSSTTVYSTSNDTMPLNTWNHVIVQSDGSSITSFVNGSKLVMSGTYRGWMEQGTVANAWFNRGPQNAGNYETVPDAAFDQYRIFARVLTDSEAAALFAEGTP